MYIEYYDYHHLTYPTDELGIEKQPEIESLVNFKPYKILEPFCIADNIIWNFNSENFESGTAQIVQLLKEKSIHENFVLHILKFAYYRRFKALQLYDKFIDILKSNGYFQNYDLKLKKILDYNCIHEEILQILENDDVETLQKLIDEDKLADLCQLRKFGGYVMQFNAIKCYECLKQTFMIDLEVMLPSYAMLGGNLEMLKDIIEDYEISHTKQTTESILQDAIDYHRHEIFDYILSQTEKITYMGTNAMYFYEFSGNITAAAYYYAALQTQNKGFEAYTQFVKLIIELNSTDKLKQLLQELDINLTNTTLPDIETPRQFRTSTGLGSMTYAVEIVRISILKNQFWYSSHNPNAMLNIVTRNGNLEIMKTLLDNGVSVNGESDESSPLAEAIINKNSEIAILLIDKGANLFREYKTHKCIYEMFTLALKYKAFDIARYIAEKGGSPFQRVKLREGGEYLTPLMMCCRYGQLDLVEWCVSKDVDVNYKFQKKPNYYMSALKYGCNYGHLDVVKYLVETEHCDVNEMHTSRNYCFNTPLTHSIESGNIELIKYLLDQHARLDVKLKEVDDSRSKKTHSYVDFAKNRNCDESIIELLSTYKPPPKQLYNGILELSRPTHYHC